MIIGKSTLLLFLHCAKTFNVKKVYIAIIFVLCEDTQCRESLHCCHFCIVRRHAMSRKSTLLTLCIVRRHSMTGKSTLLSLSHGAKTHNVKKVYIAVTLYCAKTPDVKKVYIAIILV